MALPENHNLPPILRGDSFNVPVQFTNTQDVPLDLTGWMLIFTIKHHRLQPDSDAALQKRQTVTGSDAVMVVKPGDTNGLAPSRYEYDIQLSTPDGSGVRTFLMGYIEVRSGVTHSVT